MACSGCGNKKQPTIKTAEKPKVANTIVRTTIADSDVIILDGKRHIRKR